MEAREIRIPVRDLSVTASLHGAGDTILALGHGAGGDRKTPLLRRLADALASAKPGCSVLLYNFPYTDARRRAPDPPDVLEMTARAVGDHARESLGARRVVLGGKSMGGRIASQAVAKGAAADGLLFLGYPLHPPGRPETLRDRHLPAVRVPMLFVQGTRDSFARWDLLEAVIARLGPSATLHRLEEADHSFRVPKRTGRTAADVEAEIVAAAVGWLAGNGL
jgi:predicted alpha/beta-hydrolase family hydrolase